jgi:hypothetical protein
MIRNLFQEVSVSDTTQVSVPSALLAKILAILGGVAGILSVFVQPVSDAIVAFVAAHPKLAPLASFVALVFAAFARSAAATSKAGPGSGAVATETVTREKA